MSTWNPKNRPHQRQGPGWQQRHRLCGGELQFPANDTLFLEGSAIQGTGNSDAVDTLYGNAGIISMLVAGSGTDTLVVTGIAGTAMTGGAPTRSRSRWGTTW